MIFFLNFLQNLQCFPSQTPCSGKQAFVWNSPLGGHGVQRDSGTVEQTLKSLQLDWNSWEVALLLSKSSPSGWLRQGISQAPAGAAPWWVWSCGFPSLQRSSQGRALLWLQGIPGSVSTRSGKVPVPSAQAFIENQITKQIHEETAKRCPCTTLQLPGAAPVACQPFLHPLSNLMALNWERLEQSSS